MNLTLSKPGAIVSGLYMLMASVLLFPLLRDGYIGHGNGIEFLLALVITSPLSFLLTLIDDWFSDANAFYMTGWPYYRALCELACGAILNTVLIYAGIRFMQRTFLPGRRDESA